MKKKSTLFGFINSIKFGVLLLVIIFQSFLVSCVSQRKIELTYLNTYDIPPNANISGVAFGGISGIDYDAITRTYFFVSDDRSEHNPARVYTAEIDLKQRRIDTVSMKSIIYILDHKMHPYELEGSDMESIRYNPISKLLVIGNEGGKKGSAAIGIFNLAGKLQSKLKIPVDYKKRLRPNKSFEGLSFSEDYKHLFYSTEAPLTTDGVEPNLSKGGLLRIVDVHTDSGNHENEFLYELEKVPQKAEITPPWGGLGSDNGLAELIAMPNEQFLTLERSGAYQKDGSFIFKCKVFQVYSKKGKGSKKARSIKTKKKMVFDFSSLPEGGFNIEGMTIGPDLNGNKTLLFVSDNNFKDNIPTRFFLFQMTNKNTAHD